MVSYNPDLFYSLFQSQMGSRAS